MCTFRVHEMRMYIPCSNVYIPCSKLQNLDYFFVDELFSLLDLFWLAVMLFRVLATSIDYDTKPKHIHNHTSTYPILVQILQAVTKFKRQN